jgi:hypothetical protein
MFSTTSFRMVRFYLVTAHVHENQIFHHDNFLVFWPPQLLLQQALKILWQIFFVDSYN